MTSARRTRRFGLVIALLALAALAFSACSGGGSSESTSRDLTGNNLASNDVQAPDNPDPPKYGENLSGTLTIGYVTSSGGEGKDFQLLANGGRVVPSLAVNKDDVDVVYEDDLGTPEGAEAAVQGLIGQGANVIVYGSIGQQVDAGVKAAARRNVPVIIPYDANAAVTRDNANAFTIALDTDQASQKLVQYGVDARDYNRFAIVWDADDPVSQVERDSFVSALASEAKTPVAELAVTDAPPEGTDATADDSGATTTDESADAAAAAAAQETPGDTGTTAASSQDLRNELIAVGDSQPEVLAVLGNSDFVFEVAVEWHTTGLAAAWMIPPRAATPNLGRKDVDALAPPLRGPLSTALAGGPWIQTVPIVNYYDKRDGAKSETTSDLSNADVISADAGLIAIKAAEDAGSTQPAAIERAFDGLTVEGIGGTYDFRDQQGVDLDTYAITAYNREESSAFTFVGKQFPDVRSNGGFFVALEGTAPLLENTNPFES